MRLEILCSGTELLGGKLNTNAAYLAERLASIGLDPARIVTVGDGRADLRAAFTESIARSQVVVATGGLGPTFDDLNRETLAEALGLPLVHSDEAMETVAAYFTQRGIPVPENNQRQAMVIEGARVLVNRIGTAPGQMIVRPRPEGQPAGRVTVFLLPGPPREMQAMFEELVLPYLKSFQSSIKKSAVLHTMGLGEAAVDQRIRSIVESERRLGGGRVEFTVLAHQMVIDIRVSVHGEDEMLLDETLALILRELREALGTAVFGEGADTPESVVGRLLIAKRRTLAIAESCTGGLIAQRVSSVPGCSYYFRGGVTAYSNDAKVKYLGLTEEILTAHGAVSEQCAAAMVAGARDAFEADYALAVTGIAGPGGASPGKPVGLVYIAIAGPEGEPAVEKFRFGGSRADVRERACSAALDMLLRRLRAEAPRAAAKRRARRSRSKVAQGSLELPGT